MRNRLLSIFTLAGSVFLLLYVTLAAKVIPDGLSIVPEWSISLDTAQVAPDENAAHIPFMVNGLYGYVSDYGTILYKKEYAYKATLSPYYCADYQASSSEIPVLNPAGQKVTTLKAAGFPFFQENRLYVFLPGGASVAEYSLDGSRKWLHENYAPITAFNSSQNGAIIGFADGNLTGLYPDGKKRFSFYPGGSTYQLIYGAAISSSGVLSAAVSGLDRQRMLLARYANGQNKIIFHEYLDGNVTTQTLVQFSHDEKSLYFNDATGLGVLDCSTLTLYHVPIQGRILSVEELPDNFITAFSVNENMYRLSIIENGRYLLGGFEFPAESAHALHYNDSLYVSRNKAVSKLSFVRR